MVKRDVWHRRPSFFTRSISALCRRKRRRDVERPGISGIRPKDDRYTAKRARPFARRRARTFRPFLVLMRLRNPWSLFRFRFEGCLNVADMKRLQCSQNRLHHIGGSLTLSMKGMQTHTSRWRPAVVAILFSASRDRHSIRRTLPWLR